MSTINDEEPGRTPIPPIAKRDRSQNVTASRCACNAQSSTVPIGPRYLCSMSEVHEYERRTLA